MWVAGVVVVLVIGAMLNLAIGWDARARPSPPLWDIPAIGMTTVGESIGWLLFAVAVYESARLGLIAYRLTLARSRTCLAIPLLGIGLTAVYWLIATRVWPALWPSDDTVLRFGYVAFAVAFVGLFLQTGILLIHGNTWAEQWFARHGHRVGSAYLQVVAIAVLLAWFAVTMA